jgi:hypothetical protein
LRIISFAWTTPAIQARRKTCTRRDWDDDYAEKFKSGQLLAGYDKSPRFKGHQITVIQLNGKPYKDDTYRAPESDWEAEGFAYLSSIGAKVFGVTPEELWKLWHTQHKYLWVVRFDILELLEAPPLIKESPQLVLL